MADKPKFDPSQPFEASKPAFDPNQPFEATPESPGFTEEPGFLSNTAQNIGAGVLGANQALSLGWADEKQAAQDSLKDILLGDKKFTDFPELYRQKQKQYEGINEYAKKQSPISYNVGDYGTSLLAGLASGGASAVGKEAVKKITAKQLAKLALEGGLTGGEMAAGRSKATIEGNPEQLAAETAEGATAGAILSPILGKISNKFQLRSAAKAAKPAAGKGPLRSQMGEAYEAGQRGESFNKGQDVISREAQKQEGSVKEIKNVFDEAERQLVKAKEQLLESSDAVIKSPSTAKPSAMTSDYVSNAIIQPEPQKVAQIEPFLDFLSKSNQIAAKDKEAIQSGLEMYASGGLSAKSASELRSLVSKLGFKTQDPNLKTALTDLSGELEQAIEKNVSGYGQANKDISSFLKAGKETLLSRGKDPEISKIRVGGLKKGGLRVEQELDRILTSLRDYKGNPTVESQGALDKTIANLKNLFEQNPEMAKKLQIDIPGLQNMFYKAADQTALARKVIPGALTDMKPHSSVFGVPISMGERGLLKAANIAGKIMPEKKKSSDLFKLPSEGIAEVSQTLKGSGNKVLTSLAEDLERHAASGDRSKTNAVKFLLLQNPTARRLLGYTPEGQDEGEEQK